MKKATAQGRRNKAVVSPVGLAVARQKLKAYMTELHVKVYLTDDGAQDLVLLSRLAWVLGMGLQLAHAYRPGTPEVKQIHAALRALVQLRMDGGHWPAAQAKVLHEAARAAEVVMTGCWKHAGAAIEDANFISQAVLDGSARLHHVAGAELYNQPVAAGFTK